MEVVCNYPLITQTNPVYLSALSAIELYLRVNPAVPALALSLFLANGTLVRTWGLNTTKQFKSFELNASSGDDTESEVYEVPLTFTIANAIGAMNGSIPSSEVKQVAVGKNKLYFSQTVTDPINPGYTVAGTGNITNGITIPKDSMGTEMFSVNTPVTLSPSAGFAGNRITFPSQSFTGDLFSGSGDVSVYAQETFLEPTYGTTCSVSATPAHSYVQGQEIRVSFCVHQLTGTGVSFPQVDFTFMLSGTTMETYTTTTACVTTGSTNYVATTSIDVPLQYTVNAGANLVVTAEITTPGSFTYQIGNGLMVLSGTSVTETVTITGTPTGTVSTLPPVTPSGTVDVDTLTQTFPSNPSSVQLPAVPTMIPTEFEVAISGNINYTPTYLRWYRIKTTGPTLGANLLSGRLSLYLA
jgi:hypothetical protein